MKIRQFLCSALLIFVFATSAQAHPSILPEFIDALIKNDAAAVGNFLAEDFHLIAENGKILTREQFLAEIKNGILMITQANVIAEKNKAYDVLHITQGVAALSVTVTKPGKAPFICDDTVSFSLGWTGTEEEKVHFLHLTPLVKMK